jgi:hypothetical protein
MAPMRSRTVVIAAGCGLALVTLAGCKSSAVSNAGGAPAPVTPAAAQTSAPASAAATVGGVPVCSLLPVATVAQLSGKALTTQQEDDLANAGTFTCTYTDSAGSSRVSVTVAEKNAVNSFNAGVTMYGSEAKPISGVGDKAYSGPLGQSVLFGDAMISVFGVDSDDAAVKIIEMLQPKI